MSPLQSNPSCKREERKRGGRGVVGARSQSTNSQKNKPDFYSMPQARSKEESQSKDGKRLEQIFPIPSRLTCKLKMGTKKSFHPIETYTRSEGVQKVISYHPDRLSPAQMGAVGNQHTRTPNSKQRTKIKERDSSSLPASKNKRYFSLTLQKHAAFLDRAIEP